MSSDSAYGNCIEETARLLSRSADALVYFYSYEYRGTNSMLDLLVNLQNEVEQNVQAKHSVNRASNSAPWLELDKNQIVCHGDELFSLFNLKTGNLKPYSDRDLYAQKRLITLWTEFASTRFNESTPSFYQMSQPPYFFNQMNPLNYHNHLNSKKTNLFYGPNSIWPTFKEDDNQYLSLGDDVRIERNYRKNELDFWKLLIDSELLTIEKSTEQFDYSNSLISQKYAAFAYTMLSTTIFLMIVIASLLVILWYFTKKTRSFKTSIPGIPGICSSNPNRF